ncbi:17288_t:CDS:2 [Funneliformis caledonium]|uniref:17288_t:CDS:1 n=1 Tax=Funneliformis caledonium TaxID=1117310 RepID=A0A9N9BFG1_9GLOM|nr:17288_t:CDS:2 [Funneliformis caledonium]
MSKGKKYNNTATGERNNLSKRLNHEVTSSTSQLQPSPEPQPAPPSLQRFMRSTNENIK